MGAVYKARELELERDVALKVIRPEFEEDADVLDAGLEDVDVRDRLLVAAEPAGDLPGVVLVVPQVGGRRELAELDQLGRLSLDVEEAAGVGQTALEVGDGGTDFGGFHDGGA
jgi:hypothetical protein